MSQQKEMAVRYVGNFLDGAMQSVVQKHKAKARRVRGLGQNPEPTVVQTTNPDGSVTSVRTTVNADGSKTIETVTVNTAGDITEIKKETIPASVAAPKVELTVEEKKALDGDLAKIKTAFDTFVSKCHNAFLVSQGVSPVVAGGLGLATKPKSVEKFQGLKTFAILLAGNAVGSAVETSMTNTALEEFFAEVSRVVSTDFKTKVVDGSSETFDKQAKILFAVSGVNSVLGSSIFERTISENLTPTQKYVEASTREFMNKAKPESTANYAVEIAGEIASVYHGVKRNASEGTFSAVLAGLGWFIMSRSGVGLALAQGFAKPYPGSTRSNPSAKKVIHVNRSGSKMLTHDRRSNPNDGGRSTPTLADLGKARTETIAMSAELQARGMQYTQDPAYIDSSRKAIERIEGVRRDAEHLIEVSGEMGRRLDQNYVEATYALNTALEVLGGHLDRIYERTYGESLDSKGVNYAYPSEGLYQFKRKLSGGRSNPKSSTRARKGRSNPDTSVDTVEMVTDEVRGLNAELQVPRHSAVFFTFGDKFNQACVLIDRAESIRQEAEMSDDEDIVEAARALNTALEIFGGHLDRAYARMYGESLDSKGVNYAYPSEGLYYFKLKLSGGRSNPTQKKKK